MSDGNTVRKLDDDGTMIVTFIDTPVAAAGMTQLPFDPVTCATNVSFTPTGTARAPTVSGAGRVSANRHGVIGTNDDAPTDPAADDVNTHQHLPTPHPPQPTSTDQHQNQT